MRSNFSSAVAGGEGLFNLSLNGSGVFCIEAECPKEELVEIILENDVLKIDGNYAIAWSAGLEFTVERSGKSLIGSAASAEGCPPLLPRGYGVGRALLLGACAGVQAAYPFPARLFTNPEGKRTMPESWSFLSDTVEF